MQTPTPAARSRAGLQPPRIAGGIRGSRSSDHAARQTPEDYHLQAILGTGWADNSPGASELTMRALQEQTPNPQISGNYSPGDPTVAPYNQQTSIDSSHVASARMDASELQRMANAAAAAVLHAVPARTLAQAHTRAPARCVKNSRFWTRKCNQIFLTGTHATFGHMGQAKLKQLHAERYVDASKVCNDPSYTCIAREEANAKKESYPSQHDLAATHVNHTLHTDLLHFPGYNA